MASAEHLSSTRGRQLTDEFADAGLQTIYERFRQRAGALEDGISDLTGAGEVTTLDHIDFSVVYPLVTPRHVNQPNVSRTPYDFFSVSSLRNLAAYKNVAGFFYCYSPFLMLELFDQIDHRLDWYDSIRNAKTTDELRTNMLRQLSHIPSRSTDVEAALERIIAGNTAPQMRERVVEFKSLIHDGVIRNLFEFIDEQHFYRALDARDDFDALSESIDSFRRRSTSSDPADREMHRAIDIYMILASSKLARVDGKRLYYVGQERLRRIFPRPHEYSRDILTPHLVLKAFAEVPSDRNLRNEAVANMQHRADELNRFGSILLKHRKDTKLPVAVARSLRSVHNAMNEFIYGGSQMIERDEYAEIIRSVAERPRAVRDMFDAAAKDAESAQEIVREVAESLRDESFRELDALKPNARVARLFAKLDG